MFKKNYIIISDKERDKLLDILNKTRPKGAPVGVYGELLISFTTIGEMVHFVPVDENGNSDFKNKIDIGDNNW